MEGVEKRTLWWTSKRQRRQARLSSLDCTLTFLATSMLLVVYSSLSADIQCSRIQQQDNFDGRCQMDCTCQVSGDSYWILCWFALGLEDKDSNSPRTNTTLVLLWDLTDTFNTGIHMSGFRVSLAGRTEIGMYPGESLLLFRVQKM